MGPTLVRGAWRDVLLPVVALLAFGLPAGAQQQATGTIRGQVTDAVTMRPLSGVQVSVPGTGRGALANASGQFLVLNLAGNHRDLLLLGAVADDLGPHRHRARGHVEHEKLTAGVGQGAPAGAGD